MQLILMRHGVAVERDEWQGDDHSRPLTSEGEKKTREAAQGLASLCDAPHLIATSPKIRAMQTAELARESWNKPGILEEWTELADGNVKVWLTKLRATTAPSVLLVGHEPDMSRFASLLLSGHTEELTIEWKKAGTMSLELDLKTGRATLQWMLPPRVLRKLA